MNYPTYRLSVVPTSRERKLFGDDVKLLCHNVRDLTPQWWANAFQATLTPHSIALDRTLHGSTVGVHCLVAEYFYWLNKCNVIYVASQQLIDLCWHAKFDIDFDNVCAITQRLPTAFCFAFPENARVENIALHPTLIVYHTRDTMQELIQRHSQNNVGLEYSESERVLTIQMRHESGHLASRVNSQTLLTQLLNASGEFWDRNAGGIAGAIHSGERDLTSIHGRICLQLLVYMMTFPQHVHDGFPLDMRTRDIKHSNICETRARRLSLPQRFHNSPIPHFRNGHFKTLRHERFKRDAYGMPRIIYVNDTIVGRKQVAAKTIEKD